VFFSHNKSANSTFSHNKPAKQTGCSPFFQGKNTTLIFTAPLLAVATEIEKEGDHSRKLHWGNLDEVYRLKSSGSPKEDALPSLK
jgi:hypothetical protein